MRPSRQRKGMTGSAVPARIGPCGDLERPSLARRFKIRLVNRGNQPPLSDNLDHTRLLNTMSGILPPELFGELTLIVML